MYMICFRPQIPCAMDGFIVVGGGRGGDVPHKVASVCVCVEREREIHYMMFNLSPCM